MNLPFPVSIVINNFNYGRFLGFAIESALGQSYPMTEVLVVDDGSTDHSQTVIASYGNRITPILKANGGQASALNAGFARCRGSVVIFLDADDTLHPFVVERVVRLFQANANVVRVQYRLDMIDASGNLLGITKPPSHISIPGGDLRRQLLRYGDDIPWLPTSGNAFTMAILQKILPIPESPYKICADYYLSNLSPLYGAVESLVETGGCYRVHASNHHQKDQLDLKQTRQLIVRTCQTHAYLGEHAQRLGLMELCAPHGQGEVGAFSVTFVANRLISLRLAPALHPVVGDSRIVLTRNGVRAAWQRADLSLFLKSIYMTWFILTCIAPKSVLPWLAEQLFYPEARKGWFNLLLSNLRHADPIQNMPV